MATEKSEFGGLRVSHELGGATWNDFQADLRKFSGEYGEAIDLSKNQPEKWSPEQVKLWLGISHRIADEVSNLKKESMEKEKNPALKSMVGDGMFHGCSTNQV